MLISKPLLISLIFPFCFFQIEFISGARFIVPALAVFSILVILFDCLEFDKLDFLYLVCFIVYLCLSLDFVSDRTQNITVMIKVLLMWLSFVCARNIILTIQDWRRLLLFLNLIAITVMLFDFIYRVSQVGFNLASIVTTMNANFYILKTESIMFGDSNAVGYFGVLLMSVNLLLRRFVSANYFRIAIIVITLFIFLSFSRTAIFANLVGLLLLYFYENKKRIVNQELLYGVCLILLAFAMVSSSQFIHDVLIEVSSDASGATKVKVFETLIDKFGLNIINDLFGYGYTLGVTHYGFEPGASAHAAIPLILGQVGLVGLFIYSFMVIAPIRINHNYFYVFISLLVISISFLDPNYETLFLVLGLYLNKQLISSDKYVSK